MSDDARFRKGSLLALVVGVTAAFVYVISNFLMTIVVAAIFSGSEQNQMLQRFVSVARATLEGTLLIAIVQGALGGLIFAILGISGAVLWGLLMIAIGRS